jgi:hypothetical protein
MRVSIDSPTPEKSSGSSGKGRSKGRQSGEKASLDQKQKIKAGVAVGVIVLAAAWIGYSAGLFSFGPPRQVVTEPTEAELEAFNKAAAEEEKQLNPGNARVAPMPLGIN